MAKISKSSSNYFLSYMQTQIDSLKAMNRFGTAANYERTMRSFSEFMKGKDVSFRFFNESLVERYNSYLVHKKLSRNSVSFYTESSQSGLQQSSKAETDKTKQSV